MRRNLSVLLIAISVVGSIGEAKSNQSATVDKLVLTLLRIFPESANKEFVKKGTDVNGKPCGIFVYTTKNPKIGNIASFSVLDDVNFGATGRRSDPDFSAGEAVYLNISDNAKRLAADGDDPNTVIINQAELTKTSLEVETSNIIGRYKSEHAKDSDFFDTKTEKVYVKISLSESGNLLEVTANDKTSDGFDSNITCRFSK